MSKYIFIDITYDRDCISSKGPTRDGWQYLCLLTGRHDGPHCFTNDDLNNYDVPTVFVQTEKDIFSPLVWLDNDYESTYYRV